jgi:TetR/AcrR family transcriptional regulator, mexJK operon transcriptional repressor
LGERILEIATELFLRDGYGSTSIEAIAQAAGMSKRTFYARYTGKPELFAAVVGRIVDQLRPPPEVPLLAGTSLPEILERLAGLMLHAALSPRALALNRLIIAESGRFPELLSGLGGERGRTEAVNLIASQLDGLHMPPDDARFAAGQFVQMIISWPQRRALGQGAPMDPVEQADWIHRTTRLFLSGCRGWSA